MNEFGSRVFVINSITLSHFIKKKKKKVQKWRLHKNSSHPPQMMQAEPRANQWQDASLVPVLSKLYQHRFILPFELALDSEEKVTWSHFTSWKKIKIFISFADIPLLMICIFMTSYLVQLSSLVFRFLQRALWRCFLFPAFVKKNKKIKSVKNRRHVTNRWTDTSAAHEGGGTVAAWARSTAEPSFPLTVPV